MRKLNKLPQLEVATLSQTEIKKLQSIKRAIESVCQDIVAKATTKSLKEIYRQVQDEYINGNTRENYNKVVLQETLNRVLGEKSLYNLVGERSGFESSIHYQHDKE